VRVVVTASNAASGTVYAYDSFLRTGQNGWGTADAGGAWEVGSYQSSPGPASDYSVSNGTGFIVAPGATQDVIRLPNLALADTDAYGAVSLSAIPTYPSPPNALSFDVQLRDDGTGNNLYKFHIRFTSSGVCDIFLLKTIAGSTSIIGSAKTVTASYVPGTRILFHAHLAGSTLNFSAWVAGNPEPPWMISGNDSSLTGAQIPDMRVDFRLVKNNPTFTLDNFSLVSAGTTPPASAASAATTAIG
jgi:hypothetical protein